MGFLIFLFTLILVLDCFVLVFLVLIQLPKKEAGAGLAFGGSASDALFGAGSGNVLTKITKYAAVVFFVLAITLAIMQRWYHTGGGTLQKQLQNPSAAAPGLPGPGPAPAPAPANPAATPPNGGTSVTAQASDIPLTSTNIPVPTNTAPVPEK